MNEELYPNNLISIKRVNNGYMVKKESLSEFDNEVVDGVYIFTTLAELIQDLVLSYQEVEE